MISQNRRVWFLSLGSSLRQWTKDNRLLTIYVFFFFLSALTVSPPCFAQSRNPPFPAQEPLEESVADALDTLTQDLIAHAHQSSSFPKKESQQVFSSQQYTIKDDLFATVKARHELLTALIDEHPEEVLRVALPPAVRATFPPDVQAYIEKEVEREGEVEALIEDWEDGRSRLHYSLNTNEEPLPLRFADKQSQRLLTGSQVRIKGVQVGKTVALASDSTGVQALAVASPLTSGAQRVLVMLVNFQDKPAERPVTVEFIRQVFDKTDQFFRENSYEQTWLMTDVFGWHTLPLNSMGCDYNQIAVLARQAAANAGFDLSAYDRYIYSFPRLAACGWSGLGTVGGFPSHAWINNSFAQRTISHELGHNLGLFHSRAYECGSTTLGPSCETLEYADYLDTMGFGPGHYNAFQKDRLSWSLETTHLVQGNGVHVLDLYESAPGPNPKILKIPKAPGQWYYVEYRQPLGFDGFLLSNENVRNGVVIHMGTESDGNSSYILDMTPETTSWYDPALEVGRSFSDPQSGVTITPLWVNATGAAVSVSLASQPCLHSAPTVTLVSSLSPGVLAGTPVSYTVSVKNNDGPGCVSSNFTLQASTPTTKWAAAFAPPLLTLGPGASASTTLTVTSPFSADEGTYTINVKASRNGAPKSEASTSTTYRVGTLSAPEDVSVITNKPSYVAREWVKATTHVRQDGVPTPRVKVIFTVTGPDGSTRKKQLTTNKQGAAVFRFQVRIRDPIGVYRVAVQLQNSGAQLSQVSAETSFTVK